MDTKEFGVCLTGWNGRRSGVSSLSTQETALWEYENLFLLGSIFTWRKIEGLGGSVSSAYLFPFRVPLYCHWKRIYLGEDQWFGFLSMELFCHWEGLHWERINAINVWPSFSLPFLRLHYFRIFHFLYPTAMSNIYLSISSHDL